jgi:hypothetical protein
MRSSRRTSQSRPAVARHPHHLIPAAQRIIEARSLGFVAALQILQPCVIPLAATVEVEHPQRVGSALGVPLHDGMPATTMRAPEQIANSECALHVRSMCNLRDNAGQTERCSFTRLFVN